VVTNAVRRIRRAAEVVAVPTGSGRWEAVWIGLLATAQLTDVVTTWLNLAHGNVEANPQAAAILSLGGIWLLWLSKLALVVAIAIVMLLARRTLRAYEATHVAKLVVRLPHFIAIRGTQLAVLVLTAISISNALLLPARLT
jgi:Domain of unknown function (DUF5658)